MTASEHAHDHSQPAEALFPDWEWKEFRLSDATAAKRIVLLMAGIFVVGIVLYGPLQEAG